MVVVVATVQTRRHIMWLKSRPSEETREETERAEAEGGGKEGRSLHAWEELTRRRLVNWLRSEGQNYRRYTLDK